MKITISSEKELIEVAQEALHIIANMRKFQKLWEQDYGVELKIRKKYYEAKADALIERLHVIEHRQACQIKIEVTRPDL